MKKYLYVILAACTTFMSLWLVGCAKESGLTKEEIAKAEMVAAIGSGYQGDFDDKFSLYDDLKLIASTGDAVSSKPASDITDAKVIAKQYVYESSHFPANHYLCETVFEWLADPVSRSDDWIALWWSGDVRLADDAWSEAEKATIVSEGKKGEVHRVDTAEKLYLRYDDRLAFHINLPKGDRNIKIACRAVVEADENFSVQFSYTHRKNELGAHRDFESRQSVSNDSFTPGSMLVRIPASV